MKKFFLSLSLLLLLLSGNKTSYAQQAESCGFSALHNRLLQTDSEYRRNVAQNEALIQRLIREQAGQRQQNAVYTVPVVVHVIHTGQAIGTGANITDAQIQSAITALNQDYRRLAGTNGAGNGVDTEIEFCLAVRDPNNLPTNGINRVDGSGVANYATQGINGGGNSSPGALEASVKALSRWPNNKYYNIWIVTEIADNNGGAGTQGYATFPGGNANTDGAVILYNAFGTTGNVKSYTSRNRTATHEIGHGLNLYHTFEGDGTGSTCPTETNCSSGGDRVCDTPLHMRSNSNCVNDNTAGCTAGTTAGQYQHNYMDYSSETCQNMFTAGQSTRMRAALSGTRSALISSNACMPVYGTDIGISVILNPAASSCNTTTNPVVTLKNYGSNTITGATILYNIDGGANTNYSWTGNLAGNTTLDVTLPSITYSASNHTFNASTSLPNGTTDQNTANDAASLAFTVNSTALPFSQDFESTTFPPTGWTRVGVTNNSAWGTNGNKQWEQRATSGNGTSTASAAINHYNYTTTMVGEGPDELISPPVALTGYAGANLTFKVAYQYRAGLRDTLGVFISTDCGATFGTAVYEKSGDALATAGRGNSSFAPTTSAQWRTETINLANYMGGAIVVKFQSKNGLGNNLYLDDVNINGIDPPIAEFVGTPLSGCSPLTVSFTDASTNNPTSWAWDVDNNGTTDYTTRNPTHTYTTPGTYTVKLTASNSAGPNTRTKTNYITVNPTPAAATASSNSPVCSGSTLQLSASTVANASYYWSGPNGFTSTLQNPALPNASAAMAGSYAVTTIIGNCSSTVATTPVVISNTPAAPVASSNSPVCEGNTLQLNASTVSGASYSWSGPGSFNNSTQNPVRANATQAMAGLYQVYAQANGCTSAAGSVQVMVNPTPAAPTASSNSPVCSGSQVQLSATVQGNVTYSWSGPNNFSSQQQNPALQNASTAMSGTYAVSVAAGNCTSATSTVQVLVNQTPAAPMASSNSPVCERNTLQLSANATNASAYIWSGPLNFSSTNQNPTRSNATSTMSGTYAVYAQANGCTSATTNLTVTVNPTPAAATVSSNSPVCSGSTLQLSASTVANASYYWSGPNGFTSTLQNPALPNASAAMAGSYAVTTIIGNCSSTVATTSVIISNTPAAPVASSNSPVCEGNTLQLNAGTVSGASYSWSGPGSFNNSTQNPVRANATQAMAGLYQVYAQASGCTSAAGSVQVMVNPTPAAPTASSNSPVCSGSQVQLSATVQGNVTYSWSGPNNFSSQQQNPALQNASTAMSGIYAVSVTNNGCRSSATSIAVQVNPALSFTSSTTNASCSNADGTASISANGGNGNYSYSLNNGQTFQTSSQFTGLAAGGYAVVIQDNLGCRVTGSLQIQNNSAPVINSVSVTPVNCNGQQNGSATISATASTALQYSINNGATYQSQSTFTNLAAGTYSVMVKDQNNCFATQSVTVTEPAALQVSTTSQQVNCFGGSDGSATAMVSGGSPGYSYSWSGMQNTSPTLTNAPAGNYTVTVTDSHNCQAQQPVTISQPDALSLAVTNTQNAACNGGTGSITVQASGGTSTYQYSIDGTTYQSSGFFDNLAPGQYTLTVSDQHQCRATTQATIQNSSALSASITAHTNVACNGGNSGSITITASGSAGYSYAINNGTYGSANTFTGLAAGTYTLTVKDQNGCTTSQSFTLTEPDAMNLSVASQQNLRCYADANGKVRLTANGGTAPYMYAINNSAYQSSAQFNNLQAGNYNFTVRDARGCLQTLTVAVTQPATPVSTTIASQTNASNYGAADGSVTISATGGTGTYRYSIDAQLYQNNGTFSNLAAGNYTIWVIDDNDCGTSQNVVITQPATALVIQNIGVRNLSCATCCDGQATVYAAGGTPPYQYSWLPLVSNSQTADSLCAGDYYVCVTDADNQQVCDTVSVSFVSALPLTALPEVQVYPNPASTHVYLQSATKAATVLNLSLLNMLGQTVYSSSIEKDATIEKMLDVSYLPEGMYLLKLEGEHLLETRKVEIRK